MQYAKPVTLNVEECDRLSFLPYLFGLDFLYAEASVYALAKKMMPEYEGGFWHFIRLPDGGGYMMPDGDRFHLVNGENWFDRTVSADAAGIIFISGQPLYGHFCAVCNTRRIYTFPHWLSTS
ncbi:Antirestriction protein KlcA [Escherichia coli]